ncbi:AMP-binding protein, partial [Rhodococcus sp. 1168]|uniref:AMP-binding protein n=1 Tax=Rhodococcus sp. 1168 TaxID=2018041 RepID=UPI00111C68E3
HADVPFERLVEVLNPVRSTARHPLFQVGLSFQNLAQSSLELSGLSVAGLDADTGISQFDLHLIVTDRYDEGGRPLGVGGYFTFATDLFDRSTVDGFVERFVRVLEAVVEDSRVVVGDIDVLGVGERDVVVSGWNGTSRVLEGVSGSGGVSLASLFVDRVVEVPGAVAVVFEGERLSYGEFGERVFRLARWLIGEGVGPEVLVGLGMRRGVDLLVGMYAVVMAGGAYVPLDPDQPAERNGFIVEVASPVLVLVSGGGDVGVFAGGGVSVVDVGSLDVSGFSGEVVGDGERLSVLRGSNAAYVIFTSGSTGRPKGVAVSHEA